MSAVELCGIGKSYRGARILQDLDLHVESGQYVVLLGPSGCGKTTTLRIIAGLEPPDAGTVRIDGREVSSTPPSQRDVAMVFQDDALYPHLTVRQSIAYGLRCIVSREESDRRITEAAEMVSVASLLDRRPRGLSGGELRRASVAKAIARRAPVRLLDEPLSAVDASAVHTIQDDLLRWHRSYPGTTLHVTHDGNEAMRMADKIAVMDDGRVVQFDTPTEIYRRPSTVDVAVAVGWPPISFLKASWSNGLLQFVDVPGFDQASGETASIPSAGLSDLRAGLGELPAGLDDQDRALLIGIRPDHWRNSSEQTDDQVPAIAIDAQLLSLRQIDHRWMASFQIGATFVSAMFASPDKLVVGQTHRINAAIGNLHIFDAASRRRLGH
tara:strand:- start:39145 stop:40293 length:1149 start_codon:yes stop_codon:yes gene_type:complete